MPRLTIVTGPEADKEFREYCTRKGITFTEGFRRAAAALMFIEERQQRGGSILVEENGVTREVVFFA